MELISLSGYTEEEKVHIARLYLVPRQLEENGLAARLAPDHRRCAAAGDHGVHAGSRACGRSSVRSARSRARWRPGSRQIPATPRWSTRARSRPILGPPRFRPETAFRTSRPGVATGSGLDRGRRRRAVHRSLADAGHRSAHAHRSARQRDAGIGARGAQPHPSAGARAGHPVRLPDQAGSAHPRPRRSDSQGRPVGRRHHGHGDRVGRARACRSKPTSR